MPDLDTVIKALEHCIKFGCNGCPYMDVAEDKDICPINEDSLELLKEQKKIIEQYKRADGFLAAHGWKWE